MGTVSSPPSYRISVTGPAGNPILVDSQADCFDNLPAHIP
jgi:hypothetical protein